jgi:HD-like signal output (HDOD) protein
MDLTKIEIKLSRATTLPILPSVVTELLILTKNSGANARDFERVINQDAALAAKILRTANSSYFGGNGQITTLPRAITQLGVNTIRSICMTVAFQNSLSKQTVNKRFNVGEFWRHSLAVACAAKVVACLRRSPLAEEAFVAGLVHDIGKLAMSMFMPLEANYVYDLMESQNLSQYEAEQQFLQVTHQEIGFLAAQRWQLPDIYLAPISKHHTPTEDVFEIDPLTAFVHAGNAIAYEAGLGFGPAGEVNGLDPLVKDFLGISDAQYEPLRNAVAGEIGKISLQMGV